MHNKDHNTQHTLTVGIALNADTEPLTMQERVDAVSQVLRFSEGRIPAAELQSIYEKEEQLKAAIVFAREYILGVFCWLSWAKANEL